MPDAPAIPRWRLEVFEGRLLLSLSCDFFHELRQVLRSSFADEQSGGGTTDVRRPIRPDSQDGFANDRKLVVF